MAGERKPRGPHPHTHQGRRGQQAGGRAWRRRLELRGRKTPSPPFTARAGAPQRKSKRRPKDWKTHKAVPHGSWEPGGAQPAPQTQRPRHPAGRPEVSRDTPCSGRRVLATSGAHVAEGHTLSRDAGQAHPTLQRETRPGDPRAPPGEHVICRGTAHSLPRGSGGQGGGVGGSP